MIILQRNLFSNQLVMLLVGLTLIVTLSIGMIGDVHALAQRVGDFELALDAPWRMEPRTSQQVVCDPARGDCSSYEYGDIPIQVSIHDADFPGSEDTGILQQLIEVKQSGKKPPRILWEFIKEALYKSAIRIYNFIQKLADLLGVDVSSPISYDQYPVAELQNFVSLTVAEKRDSVYQAQRSYVINDAHEVERSIGYWRFSESQSSSETTAPSPPRPDYQLCRRWNGDDCSALSGLRETSEWHSTFHYRPVFGNSAGRDVRLRLDLKVLARINGKVRERTYTQYVSVHLGEAPLPTFGNRWVYGDLHYHSQGTDNDGESAYSYRGVLQAMSAMGLDFAFATDHASNSEQIVAARPVASPELIKPIFRGLRDLSPDRFAFNIGLLNGPDGANREVVSYPRKVNAFGELFTPQLFLGSEVDVIPETGTDPAGNYDYLVGLYNYRSACGDLPDIIKSIDQGLELNDIDELLGGVLEDFSPSFGYEAPESVCDGWGLLEETTDGRRLVRDVQGPAGGRLISHHYYGRQHLLHLPTDPLREDAFIPSNTSKYGGATRRLGEILDLELAQRGKGFMFLAHPLARASGREFGRLGPDIVPYSVTQYRDVFASPHFLGLQTWNENGHVKSTINKGDARDYQGKFIPVHDLENWQHDVGEKNTGESDAIDISTADKAAIKFADSARVWDRMLLWGLDPNQTSLLSWLPSGEPRRVFMAGGSDAHGDFNFRREGYFTGTEDVTSTAIGSPRNLVYAGKPEGELLSASTGTGRPQSQAQIVQALRSGNFTVTDGPALRIAYDSNRNGVIDDEDIPMGGIADPVSSQCSFPVIVEWKSTPEFGPLHSIDLYLGVHSDRHESGVVYQAWRTLPGQDLIKKPSDLAVATVWYDQEKEQEYVRAQDGFYWYDPTEDTLAIDVISKEAYEGSRVVRIDPEDYPVGQLRYECVSTDKGQKGGSQSGTGAQSDTVPVQAYAANTRPGVKGIDGDRGVVDPDRPVETPPACDIDGYFEEADTPNRFYIRAVATTLPATEPDDDCGPYSESSDGNPECIPRRAYSNPLWVKVNTSSASICSSFKSKVYTPGKATVDRTPATGKGGSISGGAARPATVQPLNSKSMMFSR